MEHFKVKRESLVSPNQQQAPVTADNSFYARRKTTNGEDNETSLNANSFDYKRL